MPQAVQGMIIGLLISLLVGVILGFYLRQSRVNKLSAALKTSQGREQGLQREHEERLRVATAQLQQDYEAQLADKIERYQRQYEAQMQQLEAEYEARQNLIPVSSAVPSLDPQDPSTDPTPTWDTAPVSEYEAGLRQQYEARLKENTYKIQQAYEQYLRESLATARDLQQQAYDQRLTEAIARYQDEAEERLAAALAEQELALTGGGGAASGFEEGDDTEVQERLATLEAELRSTYDRRLADRIEQYQDEMSQRMAQMEEEFAARLQMAQAAQPADEPPVSLDAPSNADLEARLQADYDQRLAAAVARHQDELSERLQTLTDEYEARLQMAQASGEASEEPDNADLEDRLRQEIEATLRAEYDLKLATQLEQFQADLSQRAQDFEDGFIATMDPFTDPAIDAEALEDEGFLENEGFLEDERGETDAPDDLEPQALAPSPDIDPFPDLETFQSSSALADAPAYAPALNDMGFAASDLAEGADLGEDLGDMALDDTAPAATADGPSETASAFDLDRLDLSTLSDEDLVERLGRDEDLFDLETLAKRAGVDLEELNNLLNQPDPAAAPTAEDVDPFDNENWSSLS